MRHSTRINIALAAMVSTLCCTVSQAQTSTSSQPATRTGPQATGDALSTTPNSMAPRDKTDALGDQSTASGSGSRHENLTSEDFVKHATEANLAEIKVSELALTKAQNPDVKKFAQHMIDDHTKANSELAQVASSKHLKVPDDTDMMHKSSMKLLQTKSGANFDSAYMEQMKKDHAKAVELFRSASTSAKLDPELQKLASKLLPKLEQHEQMVSQVESKLPSRSASSSSTR
jgi:putative membrane protein